MQKPDTDTNQTVSAPVNAPIPSWNCIHCGTAFEPSPYKVKKHYRVCDSCVRQRALARRATSVAPTSVAQGLIARAAALAAQAQVKAEPKPSATIVEKIAQGTKASKATRVDATAKYVPQNGEVEEMKLNVELGLNTLLTGPTQCGKTTLSEFVCEELGREMITIQGGEGATMERIVAKDILKNENGVTVTVRPSVNTPETWSVLPQAMHKGAILYVDEPNMIPSEILAYLFSAMDGRRNITFDDGTVLKAKDGFCVICAMNEGQGYTGTTALNAAFRARSKFIWDMDYLPKARESALVVSRTGIDKDMADKLCECVATLRKSAKQQGSGMTTPIGTSAVLACAQRIVKGANIWNTLRGCIINQVPSTKAKERSAVSDVIAAYFGKETK